MKRKLTLLVIATLLALSMVVPAGAKPDMYLEMQCEITDIQYVTADELGWYYDVSFVGVAGGPDIIGGTVEGVDHVLIEYDGTTHLNVYYTITDKRGEQISAHITGISVPQNPGRTVFVEATATVIDTIGYPTTEKFSSLVDTVFRDEGFLTAVTMDPPGGRIHAKWYWIE